MAVAAYGFGPYGIFPLVVTNNCSVFPKRLQLLVLPEDAKEYER